MLLVGLLLGECYVTNDYKSPWHIRSISFSFSQVCGAAGTALCWAADWDQVHSTFLSFSLDQKVPRTVLLMVDDRTRSQAKLQEHV